MSKRKIMKTFSEEIIDEIKDLESTYAFIENEDVVMCDVDDTLLMWDDLFSQPHGHTIPVIDPYDNSVNYLTLIFYENIRVVVNLLLFGQQQVQNGPELLLKL